MAAKDQRIQVDTIGLLLTKDKDDKRRLLS
jgi:hypothetical protein